ncbi:MAG: hypothetical protein KDK27_12160 [Leptospiraceae bacterium]|nr:hypothetical protein [Leptospiraceae bacterium]
MRHNLPETSGQAGKRSRSLHPAQASELSGDFRKNAWEGAAGVFVTYILEKKRFFLRISRSI